MLIAGLPAIGFPNVVGAGAATAAGRVAAPEGVAFEMLTFAAVETLPPAPAAMVLQRYRLEPGAVRALTLPIHRLRSSTRSPARP